MVLTDKLVAIANSIRKRTGGTELLNLDEMANSVLVLPHGNTPAYHYEEASHVAEKIQSFKAEHPNNLVFGTISDNHVLANDATKSVLTEASIRHAAFALETVGLMTSCDFIANLGDNCWENGIDTDNAYEGATYVIDALRPAFSRLPSYNIVGNHDKSDDTQRLFNLIGATNDFDDCGATKIRGFGYKDYDDKKVRIICLNSVDYLNASGGYGMSYEQKDFLMRSLDLSAKSNATDWEILLLSHIPLDFTGGDYNTGADVKSILDAYTSGTVVSIAVNSSYALNEDPTAYVTYSGGSLTYDYSGKNVAKIIANIHGHVHTNAYGKMADNNILRMATPNTCFYLDKTESYPNNGDYSITLTEASKLAKTSGTAKDTSATFYCIDLDKQEIYAFGYGANTDRVASYSDLPMHSIVYNLTNCTSSNAITAVAEGEEYSTYINAEDNCTMTSVMVTMGGTDISQMCDENGYLSIPSVTGDIIITAVAVVPLVEHLVTDLVASSRTAIEYYDTVCFNSYNVAAGFTVSTENECVFTDRNGDTRYLIPIPDGMSMVTVTTTDTLFQKAQFVGVNYADEIYTKVFDTNKTTSFSHEFEKDSAAYLAITLYYDETEADGKVAWGYDASQVTVVFSNGGVPSDSFVIVNNLTNVTTNNSTESISNGSAYNATISPNGGYTIQTVTVTMGGVDVTGSVYSDGIINIPSVTGDIIITAVASETSGGDSGTTAYTNLFSADDPDFADLTRFSSSGGNTSGASAFVSGYIVATAGDVIRVRCPDGNYSSGTGANLRCICTYTADKTNVACLYPGDITLDADGAGFQYTIPSGKNIEFIRVSGNPNGNYAGFIVTKNEEII